MVQAVEGFKLIMPVRDYTQNNLAHKITSSQTRVVSCAWDIILWVSKFRTRYGAWTILLTFRCWHPTISGPELLRGLHNTNTFPHRSHEGSFPGYRGPTSNSGADVTYVMFRAYDKSLSSFNFNYGHRGLQANTVLVGFWALNIWSEEKRSSVSSTEKSHCAYMELL